MKNVVRLSSQNHSQNQIGSETNDEGLIPGFVSDGEPKFLRDLDFVDLYICMEGNGKAHFRPRIFTKSGVLDVDVPADFQEDIEAISYFLRHEFKDVEAGLTYDGVRLRAAKLHAANGEVWAAMRRVNDLPPLLDNLGFVPELIPVLRQLGLRDGLTLITGSTGNGKTTTSSSLLLDYLDNYGGVAFTLEDPVEYRLDGRRGKNGYCYQSEIQEEGDWGEMLKRALRWHPRYIFVGEIRTPEAANQLLRAATSGHTVLATMHAGSLEEGLEGLLQLAEISIGARASMLLASGLTATINQTLSPQGLHANFIVTEPFNLGSPVRSLIRERRIGQARTFADQQKALLQTTGKLFSNHNSGGLLS